MAFGEANRLDFCTYSQYILKRHDFFRGNPADEEVLKDALSFYSLRARTFIAMSLCHC